MHPDKMLVEHIANQCKLSSSETVKLHEYYEHRQDICVFKFLLYMFWKRIVVCLAIVIVMSIVYILTTN